MNLTTLRTKFLEFRKKWNGRRINGYSRNGGQCIDAGREFVKFLTGDAYHGIPRVAGAQDWFNAADPKKWLKIRNNPNNHPPDGAIVVCARGRWGHLFMAYGCTATELAGWGQNWTVQYHCAAEHHDTYAEMECIGWLIPR